MKTGAIIRIIVFGLIALVLTGVLAYFLAGGRWAAYTEGTRREDVKSDDSSSFGSGGHTTAPTTDGASSDAAEPSTDSGAAAAEPSTGGNTVEPAGSQQQTALGDFSGVTKLEIEWISGSVSIEPADGELSFTEDGTGEDKYQMSWRIIGDTLYISDFSSSVKSGLFLSLPSKQLTVYLPSAMLEELEITTTSADVALSGIEARKLDVETVSGRVSGVVTRADEADIETVSGQIDVAFGQCGKLDVSTNSGSVQAVCYAGLREADLESVSGKLDLTIPMGSGCRLEWETVSGSLDDQTASGGGFGSGAQVEIDAETVSGGLTIRNAAQQELP